MKNKSLNRKQQIEKEYHDNWARHLKLSSINFRGAFEAVTVTENKFALSQIGPLKGKKILDLGCGMGDASIYFASKGANVYSIDISPGMLDLVRRMATKFRLSKRVKPKIMAAENLDFPDNYFDSIYGCGVLHHVDPKKALAEAFRVLKPGGVSVFIEPLRDNPVINIYRRLANGVRTPTEKPMDYDRLDRLTREKFKLSFHKEFHLMTLLIFVWYYVADRVSPNKERYWKKIIDESERVKLPFLFLKTLDDIILRIIPGLRRYCWYTVLVYQK